MLAVTSNDTSSALKKHDTAKKWLHTRLWKSVSRQMLRGGDNEGMKRKLSVKRPQTAPASGRVTQNSVPPVRQLSIDSMLPLTRLAVQPPPRPPRPNSGVIRDVNAWLDASTSVSPPPLMDGLPYWRSTSTVPTTVSLGTQYAIPVVREPGSSRPPTPSSQHMKSICRRGARKAQAKVPSVLRTTSQRIITRKQSNQDTSTMPLLPFPYEQIRQATPPKLLTQSRSFLLGSARTSTSRTPTGEQALLSADQHWFEFPVLSSTETSITCSDSRRHVNRHVNALFGYTARSGEHTHRLTAGAQLSREGSMGDLALSEAPTYSSGRPPPSYRSRTASIMTTSSFGCVDGISSAQKHVGKQRAAEKSRGVRGRVRELRKIFPDGMDFPAKVRSRAKGQRIS